MAKLGPSLRVLSKNSDTPVSRVGGMEAFSSLARDLSTTVSM